MKKKRTARPAAASRATKVEAAHQCAIWRCRETSHLEQHHIDGNPTNHAPDNLILLCRQHHVMADRNEISRQELIEYKAKLQHAALLTEKPELALADTPAAIIAPYQNNQTPSYKDSNPELTTVLIDQSHRQAEWEGYPTPDDGYMGALNLLQNDIFVAKSGPLTSSILEQFNILILPTPFGTMVDNEEYEAIARWVYAGNGLLVFGNYLMESHLYMNLNMLAHKFGIEFSHDLVMPLNQHDFRSCMRQAFGLHRDLTVVTKTNSTPVKHAILSGVNRLAFQSSCTVLCSTNVALSVSTSEKCSIMKAIGPKNKFGKILQIQDYLLDKQSPANFMVGLQHGKGRVLAIGSWKIFLNEFVQNEMLDNRSLFLNSISWLKGNI